MNRGDLFILLGGAVALAALADRAINGEASMTQSALDAIADALTPDGQAEPYLPTIRATEIRHGIPEGMLFRLLYQESHFRPDIISGRKRSSVGALGIAQFMPATAAELKVDPLDPFAAIAAAGRYLASLYRMTGDWSEAVAAYNWGIGNLQRKGLARAPKETRDYVAFIVTQGGYA